MTPSTLLRRLGLSILMAMLPSWALAAGFDCHKAATPMETAICANGDLSLADFVLTERYQHLVSHCTAASEKPERVENQRRWLAQTRAAFAPGDEGLAALRDRYKQRNVELERDLAACTLRRREFTPLNISTVASTTSSVKLLWVEAPSPEVSRRINDVIFNRFLDGPAPARLADATALLPPSEGRTQGLTSSELRIARNDGRLLAIIARSEDCSHQCEEFTDQWLFDARTGRQLELDALFTEPGKQAVARYFSAARAAKARELLARAKKDSGTEPDELLQYKDCVRGWSHLVDLPDLQLDDKGRWHVPAGDCSSGYRRLWDALNGIDIPLPEPLVATHLSAYGRSVLLGKGNVLDPAPPAPRCTGAMPLDTPTTSPFKSLAFGDGHRLALLADGKLLAWGEDDNGQLGRGEQRHDNQRMPPQAVAIATPVSTVAAGHGWSAALGADGTIWTWGNDYMGALGRAIPERTDARPVSIGGDYVQLRAQGFKGLALRRDGSLWTWGGRVASRIDVGHETWVTTPWKLGDGFAQIELGPRGDFQALTPDGTLWSWGGFTSDGSHLPEDAPRKLGEGFTRLAGHGLQAAFKADGSLWAWAGSLSAMIDTGNDHDRPPQLVGNGFAQVVDAPDDLVAALKTDGSLWLTHTRGSVTQLEPVGCGYRRVALVGASWEMEPEMKVQVVALRDDDSLVAWPAMAAEAAASGVAGPVQASAAAPLKLGSGWRELDVIDGQWGDRGPELLAVDGDGKVWQRRDPRGSPPLANPRDGLELVELPASRPTSAAR